MEHKQIAVAAVCAGLAASVGSPAWAQDGAAPQVVDQAGVAAAEPSQASSDASSNDAGEVVVTAQRRTERLVDVPISIVAISGTLSRDLGAQSTRDISQLVPGVVIPSQGVAVQPTIRAITSQGTSAGDEANVATYVDDFYVASSYESTADLADVERIEVLKGPQGTLFGRNATGGAIKIITRTPQFTPEAHLTASYGFDFNEARVGGFVTGPLLDSVAGSIAANYVTNDGYVYNIQTGNRAADRDLISIRSRLLIDFSSNFRTVLTGSFAEGDDNAVFALSPFEGNHRNYTDPALVKPDVPEEIAGIDPLLHFRVYGAQANSSLSLGSAQLTSITGYRDSRAQDAFDTDRTLLPITSSYSDISTEQFTQELTLTTDSAARIAGTAGLYYFDSETTYISTGFSGDLVFDREEMPAPTGKINLSAFSNVATKSFAGFGEATVKVTEDLTLIGGLRYTTEKKVFNYRDLVRAAGLRQIVDAKERWNSLTYRAIAQYQFSRDFNVYASLNTGFKSGVFASLTFPTNKVNPEEITAYELGAKAKIGAVNLSAAAFHYDYSDIQVQASNIVNGVRIVNLFNAAKARVQGLDFSAAGSVSRFLTMNVGVGWLPTAKYTSFPDSQVAVPRPIGLGNTVVVPFDSSGSRMIRAPRLTANLGAAAKHPLAGGMFLATGNISYNSGYYFQPGNIGFQKPYTVVNGSIGWRIPSEKLTISLFAENLFNERYGIYRTFNALATTQAYNRPRLIGIRLQTDFGPGR